MSNKNNQRNKRQTEEIVESFEFLRKINFIVANMREANEGIISTSNPGEKKEGVPVLKVEFPETGGTYAYYQGEPYPVKGFCYGDVVEKVDEMKKLLLGTLKSFVYLSRWQKIRGCLLIILFGKTTIKILEGIIISFHSWIRRYRLRPIRYCRACRELHRVGSMDWGNSRISEALRDISCMTLEYDDAYRYPFQDIFSELNKENVRKNALKEIKRLFSILRQRDESLAKKWKAIETVIILFLIINPKAKKIMRNILLELNIDEIKLDEADLHFAKKKPRYNWEHYEKEKKAEEK